MINIKGQKLTRYMHSKCKPKPFHCNQDSSFPSASPSHFIIIKVQACQVSSILNGSRRSKWPNFAPLHIWFAISWLSLKFVCLFHISMFLWILKIHVAFYVLCSCIYLKKKFKKKKFKIPKSFLKKEKNFQIKKNLWTRGIEPLSHLKKKKNLWTRGIGLPREFFSKKTHFFSFKDFKIL